MSKKQLTIYISILFIVGWSIQLLAIAVNGSINADKSYLWLAITMISPALITLAYLKKYKVLRDEVIVKPNNQIINNRINIKNEITRRKKAISKLYRKQRTLNRSIGTNSSKGGSNLDV